GPRRAHTGPHVACTDTAALHNASVVCNNTHARTMGYEWSALSAPLERQGDIRSQTLEHRQVNPEHGQWLQQPGDAQRSGVQHLETELCTQLRHHRFGLCVVTAQEHRGGCQVKCVTFSHLYPLPKQHYELIQGR